MTPGIEEDVDLILRFKGQLKLAGFTACSDSELELADDGIGGGMDAEVQVLSVGFGHLRLPASIAPPAHWDDHVGAFAHLRVASWNAGECEELVWPLRGKAVASWPHPECA